MELSHEELLDAFEDQRLLIEIGRDLMHERNLDKLLRKILDVSRQMTGADAGSIYLTEEIDSERYLRFKYSFTASRDLPYEEFLIPRSMNSIAGYVSLTGETVNIPDAYQLPPEAPYKFNKAFDLKHGYRSKSILAVPMNDHAGSIVGVIQLLNSKETHSSIGQRADTILLNTAQDFEEKVVPFKQRYCSLLEAVASQAAIALENATMIRQINGQFEQFVAAAVEAVEARDPATSGHSSRVAHTATALARLMNEENLAAGEAVLFSDQQLKELEYAGLLHDFGKVYIEPAIFLKAKKLFLGDMERLQLRLKYLRRSLELLFVQGRPSSQPAACTDYDQRWSATLQDLCDLQRRIQELNEPSVLKQDPQELITQILSTNLPPVSGVDNEVIPLLTDFEIQNLSVPRGSLNEQERKEIERHVTLSYEFVRQIPWPRGWDHIPDYVLAHHEMLDGSGYPNHLCAERIPLQARLLAVADIFDALTASDRPYKHAVPPDKAISILREEAGKGRLDGAVVSLFARNLDRVLSATPGTA